MVDPVDEHVADRVIADAFVHRQHRSALDQRSPSLDADAFGHRGRRGAMRRFAIGGRSLPQARIEANAAAKCGRPPAPTPATSQIWHMASSLISAGFCPRRSRRAARRCRERVRSRAKTSIALRRRAANARSLRASHLGGEGNLGQMSPFRRPSERIERHIGALAAQSEVAERAFVTPGGNARRSTRSAEASTRSPVCRQKSWMRAAVLTVSPRNTISVFTDPISPVTRGPQCSPARKMTAAPNSRRYSGAFRASSSRASKQAATQRAWAIPYSSVHVAISSSPT